MQLFSLPLRILRHRYVKLLVTLLTIALLYLVLYLTYREPTNQKKLTNKEFLVFESALIQSSMFEYCAKKRSQCVYFLPVLVLDAHDIQLQVNVSYHRPPTYWVFESMTTGKYSSIIDHFQSCINSNPNYTVAILPRYVNFAKNFGHFVLDVLGSLHSLLQEITKSLQEIKGYHRVWLVIPPHYYDKITLKYIDLMHAIGIHSIISYQDIQSCMYFNKVITPTHMHKASLSYDAVNKMKTYFNISDKICRENSVTFVDRKTSRRILNIQDLLMFARSRGYKNSEVVYMEDVPRQYQMQIIHCTQILIGIQGAAMTWFPFLPQQATFVEMGFEGWPADFYSNRTVESGRTDLKVINLHCDIRTTNQHWKDQAKVFNLMGELTPALKQRVLQRSYSGDFAETIWKRSNCFCKRSLFEEILPFINTPADLSVMAGYKLSKKEMTKTKKINLI